MSGRANGHLRLVPEVAEARPSVTFCGHCGQPPQSEKHGRVCDRCGLGVLLTARADSVPKLDDPFLIVDGSLCICAVSRLAEELLGVVETGAVNRHLSEFLVPADAETGGPENLVELVIRAARDDAEMVHTAVVRPPHEFGVRFRARVGACGPPRAALLVLSTAWA